MRFIGMATLVVCLLAQNLKGGNGAAVGQTVLVHDLAGVPARVMQGAQEEVAGIFARAGVAMEFAVCGVSDGGRVRPCPGRGAGVVTVRIGRETMEALGRDAMGYAAVSHEMPVFAAVSLTRVKQSVESGANPGVRVERVLGHAMAHEIGHLLLGPNAHGASGLMRPDWDRQVFEDMAKGRLAFSARERRRIREAVVRRGGVRLAGLDVSFESQAE